MCHTVISIFAIGHARAPSRCHGLSIRCRSSLGASTHGTFGGVAAFLLGRPNASGSLRVIFPNHSPGGFQKHAATRGAALVLADGRAHGLGVADAGVGRAHRVGDALGRIVGVVGGAAAGGVERMHLDQLAVVVDADEAGIAADLDALPDIARGDGVQGAAELDVVIRMDRGRRPGRAISSCCPGNGLTPCSTWPRSASGGRG